MTTERDRLTADISSATDHWAYPLGMANAEVIAADLEAKGYFRPRTITTAEELDALPSKSIIIEVDGTPTRAIKRQDGKNWWIDGPHGMSSSDLIPLPVTVLWEPQP